MLCNPGSSDGRLKWIEIHAHEIYGQNAMTCHRRHVFRIVAHAKQAAMHLGVQGLHTPIHHFRKASDAFDGQDL